MSDFQRVDPKGWEYDLHSVYSAYLGHFQVHDIAWYERSWGHYFESFQDFLTYTWPAIVVTDASTGRAHIVTRMDTISGFMKMIRTRFGDTLPQVTNILTVTPLETSPRRLQQLSDWTTYKKLHATLPAAVLAALKTRVRGGDPSVIRRLWGSRDKTFMAIDFEWSERNPSTVLEWGYAAVRCGHLSSVGSWPPDPETNYRKGHYAIEDYIHQQHNKIVPNHPWQYAFGDSQRISKTKSGVILQAIISSLATPDSETSENNLVLVGHGIQGDLQRLEEIKIKIPNNVLVIDTAVYERQLFASGARGQMSDGKTGGPRAPGSTLSLGNIVRSFGIDLRATLHNAGNDAFLTLLAFQMFVDAKHTVVPPAAGVVMSSRASAPTIQLPAGNMPTGGAVPSPSNHFFSGYMVANTPSPGLSPGVGYFDAGNSPSRNMRQSPGLAGPASMGSRNARRRSSLTPDEIGTMPARSRSAEKLSRSMRDLSTG